MKKLNVRMKGTPPLQKSWRAPSGTIILSAVYREWLEETATELWEKYGKKGLVTDAPWQCAIFFESQDIGSDLLGRASNLLDALVASGLVGHLNLCKSVRVDRKRCQNAFTRIKLEQL